MIYRNLKLFTILLLLLPAGCGYRFVDPFQASGYTLVSVKNVTAEAGLATLLEEEMRRMGGFREQSEKRVQVVVTRFSEAVESVSSEGLPVRQKLTMEVKWRIEAGPSSTSDSHTVLVNRSYPHVTDTASLDWNRSAAIRLLTQSAAQRILEGLGEQP